MADVSFKKWQCGACGFIYNDITFDCGFIYDEELGDEEEGFPPGTRFKDIDDNWICPGVRFGTSIAPYCGATKDIFVEVKE